MTANREDGWPWNMLMAGELGGLSDAMNRIGVPFYDGKRDGTIALLHGIVHTLAKEADETEDDFVNERLVFLISYVLDTIDELKGYGVS